MSPERDTSEANRMWDAGYAARNCEVDELRKLLDSAQRIAKDQILRADAADKRAAEAEREAYTRAAQFAKDHPEATAAYIAAAIENLRNQ